MYISDAMYPTYILYILNCTHFKIYFSFQHPIRSNIPTASPLAIVKVQLRLVGEISPGNNFQGRRVTTRAVETIEQNRLRECFKPRQGKRLMLQLERNSARFVTLLIIQ